MSLVKDGVLLLNRDGVILFAEPAAEGILELSADSAGKSLVDLGPEPMVQKLVAAALAQDQSQEAEFVSSGLVKQKTLSLTVEPYVLADSGARGWIVLARDLTSIRRLETIERDFITNVSHELRTPLTSIKMAAESLQMGAIANEKFKERFLSNIQREADRLTRLVNELIVLSNVHEAKTALHLSNFELAELLEDVVSTMLPHAKVNDIGLVSDFDAQLPLMSADRDRLLQVLINLVDNAIKCNRPNGTVTLAAHSDGQQVTLKVTDTGIGIPSIDLPRIFDRFFRVDKARSRVTGGTGLGLSIVKDIIEAHGGTIAVDSTVNVGTTFTMRVPVRTKAEEET
ncbi:MAG: PAS domain-containing sensor histidine kinase [Candidatus Melainabacteria bacterium HGW-Melainabacteria-1]|nr:MAG: PAS domain-containing sensor histidine kinase [Candidatus Melainabacteria bacterium HGW-Melainabacteria-1]